LSLDNSGNVHTYLIQGQPTKTINWLALKETDPKPMDMVDYYKLDYKFFLRPTSKIGNEKEVHAVTYTEFFAQYTILGFQQSILVGLKSK
jgi:hypothetical protein